MSFSGETSTIHVPQTRAQKSFLAHKSSFQVGPPLSSGLGLALSRGTAKKISFARVSRLLGRKGLFRRLGRRGVLGLGGGGRGGFFRLLALHLNGRKDTRALKGVGLSQSIGGQINGALGVTNRRQHNNNKNNRFVVSLPHTRGKSISILSLTLILQ